jgi:peroxiredoxin Q/BCP
MTPVRVYIDVSIPISMVLKIGSQAPDFEGITDTGLKFKLSDTLREKDVILYFYPKDETPGCSVEACSFRDNWDELKKLNAEVVGISSDSIESHRKFREHRSLKFILISDEDQNIRLLYDVKGRIAPPRVTYVISRSGKIIHVYNSQFAPRKHVQEAMKALLEAGK